MIDLAALKVKEKTKLPLPAMPLGYSEVVKTGDWTIVLGNLHIIHNVQLLHTFVGQFCEPGLCFVVVRGLERNCTY